MKTQNQIPGEKSIDLFLTVLKIMLFALFMVVIGTYYVISQPVTYSLSVNANEEIAVKPMPFLRNFSVRVYEDIAYMQWNVIGQTRHCLYLIERSTDSIHFEVVAAKAGIGCLPTLNILYCSIDSTPPFGTVFYRLTRIGDDLSFSASETMRVAVGLNPVRDRKTAQAKHVTEEL